MENKTKSARFRALDILYILIMILPLIAGMIVKILTNPASEGISITGAKIYFTVPLPLGGLPITEAQVNAWIVVVSLFGLCLYLTHGITARGGLKRQIVAEWIVEQTQKLVNVNMDPYFSGYAPFVGAILALSALSSLLTLVGLFPPTSDLNVIVGWAVMVFCLITYYKMKCGVVHYLKSFGDPLPAFAFMNIIGEFATPVSMSFRHYGNVLSGAVISTLIAYALQNLSKMLLGWLPGVLGEIPFLQIGLPAILSVYFDLFSGCMQAFIFAMLTMLYVSGAFPADDYAQRKAKKAAKKPGH